MRSPHPSVSNPPKGTPARGHPRSPWPLPTRASPSALEWWARGRDPARDEGARARHRFPDRAVPRRAVDLHHSVVALRWGSLRRTTTPIPEQPRALRTVRSTFYSLSHAYRHRAASSGARAAGDQFAGPNIQMAAGSFAARTAKKSRSTCGTQSDVLAPAAVARCVTLTKPSACAANISRNPSPQLM